MDIKFVGSGMSAKVILYYITDYITKTQLKTHVVYAALELAVARLGEYDPTKDNMTFRAKRMLQRCAYTMLSHQELSAAQVISYLMDYDNHFTSHKFVPFNWSSPENYVNRAMPLMATDNADISIESAVPNEHDPGLQPDSSSPDTDDTDPVPATLSSALLNQDLEDYDMHSEDVDDQQSPAPSVADDVTVRNADGDEVVLHLDDSNNPVKCPTMLENYLCCSPELEDVSFWDYVSRVEKVLKTADSKSHKRQQPIDDLAIDSDEDNDMSVIENVLEQQ